mmetsp:Transcript_34991/g.35631  ORF Transcript_34991/g.35631 Transcript_34991/m.35631 type:complete len:117 (-) Transcript_34991:77-427(-)
MRRDCCENDNLVSLLTSHRDDKILSLSLTELKVLMSDWSFLTESNRRNISVLNKVKDLMVTMLIAFRTKGDRPYNKIVSGARISARYTGCEAPVASNVTAMIFGDGIESPRFSALS